jgi:hypothetical protein
LSGVSLILSGITALTVNFHFGLWKKKKKILKKKKKKKKIFSPSAPSERKFFKKSTFKLEKVEFLS